MTDTTTFLYMYVKMLSSLQQTACNKVQIRSPVLHSAKTLALYKANSFNIDMVQSKTIITL